MILAVSEKFSGLTTPTVGSAYKEKVMHQIIKIVGVPAEKIGALHEAIRGAISENTMFIKDEEVFGNLPVRPEIIKSALDTRDIYSDVYTVTIKVPIATEGSGRKEGLLDSCYLYSSIKMLRKIYDAIGVFPDEEKFVGKDDLE